MIIKTFKEQKELQTQYSFPKTHQFLLRDFDALTVSDDHKKCVILFDFGTKQMCQWFIEKDASNSHLKVVNALIIGTDETVNHEAIFEIIESKYNLPKINCVGFINILEAYRNIGTTPNDKFNIKLKSFHDNNRIGGILRVQMDINKSGQSYDFISSLTSNKLTTATVKEKLGTWIKDTQKMHSFITSNSLKIIEFDDFIQLLSEDFDISISPVFHRSYFQQFRSFVLNLDIDRFSELMDTYDGDRYDMIWNHLDSIGKYSPTYNFKGIKIQPTVSNINVTFLGSSFKIKSSHQMDFKIILTALDMVDQLGTLENYIERTKLING